MDVTVILDSLGRSESLLMPCNVRELRAMETDSKAQDYVGLWKMMTKDIKWSFKMLKRSLKSNRDAKQNLDFCLSTLSHTLKWQKAFKARNYDEQTFL